MTGARLLEESGLAAAIDLLIEDERALAYRQGFVAGRTSMTPLTMIGMAGHPWQTRLAETGPVHARRTFVSSLTDWQRLVSAATEDKAAMRASVLSTKASSWGGAASGADDATLSQLADALDDVGGNAWLAVHHEPAGDGDAAAYAAMQKRVLPMLRRDHVQTCVILNGFWFSHDRRRKPLSSAEIARWVPDEVLEGCDLVAADCYHGGTPDAPGGEPNELMQGMAEWADAVGWEGPLGVGEFSGHTAAAIANVGRVLFDQYPGRFAWACIFNSDRNNRPGVQWSLTGERLAAFKELVRRAGR